MYVCVYDSLRHRRARAHAATIIITSPMRTLHDSTRAVDMREAVAACDPASLTARSSHPPRMITGHSAWQTEFRVVERGQTESYWFPECGERKSHEIARWERDPGAPHALAGHVQRETPAQHLGGGGFSSCLPAGVPNCTRSVDWSVPAMLQQRPARGRNLTVSAVLSHLMGDGARHAPLICRSC